MAQCMGYYHQSDSRSFNVLRENGAGSFEGGAKMMNPISGNGRWEVRRRDSNKGVIGQFVTAHTAFEAWQKSRIKVSFNEVRCILVEKLDE